MPDREAIGGQPADARQLGAALSLNKTAELLDLVGRSGMVERGEVLLISLEPIKVGFGETKWSLRRPVVLQHAERHFRAELGVDCIWVAVGDTQCLAGSASAPGTTTSGLCYGALRDVLTHFLGEFDPGSIRIDRVESLSGKTITAQAISNEELRAAEQTIARKPKTGPAPDGRLTSEEPGSWLVQSLGKDIRASLPLQSVYALSSMAIAGHTIEPRLVDATTGTPLGRSERRAMLPKAVGQIALAALDYGISLAGRSGPSARPRLVVPISFTAVSNAGMRQLLLDRLRTITPEARRVMIVKIVDLEEGVPAGRLKEVVELMRSHWGAVFLKVDPAPSALEAARHAGAAGLSVDASLLGGDARSIRDGMRRFVAMASKISPVLVVTSLPPTELPEAQLAGFTLAASSSPPDHLCASARAA